MLLRQDLGRRHEGDLEPVLHCHERGDQRDDGLAGTDVSLQQPVHGLRPLHVADDFAERLLLIAGQLEGQDLPADSRISSVITTGRDLRSDSDRLRRTIPS